MAALICTIGIAATVLWRLWPFTVDDTFITLRYARHLASGLGLVWNAGPVHDEGYTSPLWTVLLALPHVIGLDGEGSAKLLSLLTHLGAIAACAALARVAVRTAGPDTPTRATWYAPLLYALYPAAAVHAVSGMETAAFTLALTALAWCAARALESRAALHPWRLAALALATGLTRPEGNVAALVVLGTLAWMLERAERVRLLRALVLCWVLPGALYFAWRWNFYGELLPLPFYSKMAGVAPWAGAARVFEFLRDMALGIGVPLAFGLALTPRPLRPALAGALSILLFYLFPEHVMGFHVRYLVPVAPILFALAGAGFVGVERLTRMAGPSLARVSGVVGGLLALVCAGALLSRAPATIASRRMYADGFDRAHRSLARELSTLPIGRIAISDAGIIPYRSDWPTLDMVGLNDRHIARTHDRSPQSVLGFQPDVLVLASQDSARFIPFHWNQWEGPVLGVALAEGFLLAARYRFHDGYWLWMLADSRTSVGRRLITAHPKV
ncbi:MAG: hypothetical protein ABIU54_05555 [Candidatus Eisenbacteria bacterium]